MQLYKKRQTFSSFFAPFLKCKPIFEHFESKMNLIAYASPKLRTAKDVVRTPFNNQHCFRTSFNNQHVKGTQRLLKSPQKHFSHAFVSLSLIDI